MQLFLPVKHTQNTRCSFQNGAEVPKGTGPGVYTVTDPPKGTGPGVYTVTDPFGTGTVPKTGPAFLKVQLTFSDLIGNGLTVRLAVRYGTVTVPCEQKAYPARFLDRNHLESVPCEHSLKMF